MNQPIDFVRRQRKAFAREGSGQPVLLLHPFMTSHHIWRPVMSELSQSYDVLAPTMPGHRGLPRSGFFDAAPDRIVAAIERDLDERGWETCHIAGNSLGGWIALELAKRGRARSVTAFAPAGAWEKLSPEVLRMGLTFVGLAPLAKLAPVLAGPLSAARPLSSVLLKVVSEDISQVERADLRELYRSVGGCSGFWGLIVSALFGANGASLIGQVQTPTRLVLCDKDRIVPPGPHFSALFEQGLGNVEVIRMPGMGHVPMLQDPTACARLIAEHIAACEADNRDLHAG